MSGKQTTGKKRKERHNFDYVLLTVVLFLVGFGLLMIYSTSSYEAGIDYGDSAYFLKKQAGSTLLGFVAMFFISRIPYQFWKRWDAVAIIGSAILILAVLTPLGIKRNGALRWLNLGFITMQPAEVAKIGVIIYEASIITKLGKSLRTPKGLAVVLVPPALLALMLWQITNNMSSAIIVFGIAMAVLFVAVPDYKHFVALGATGIAGVTAMVFFAISSEASGEFRMQRIRAWLNPEAFSTDTAFQTLQALYAIGSGGIWGKGLGQSMQKRGFLPESQNDMIFSIICEELGLFGAIAVIFLFIVLIWCCMVIANNTVDLFGALLVVGIMAHYAIQVILNIAVVTNTIPNTGISLPFISYGGTSVLFLLAEIGIVLNVSKHVNVK